MTKTLEWYNQNAIHFSEDTANLEFSENQNVFVSYLNKGAKILDFGCGAGRDSKMFLQNGFDVDAVDGSSVLCENASHYVGIPVKEMLFQELNVNCVYDGIWACASLLHLNYEELKDVFPKIHKALKNNGVFYASFKYGEFEGIRNGRYFTDMSEEKFKTFLKEVNLFSIEKMWITNDIRKGRENERWLNVIMRKREV